jgi:hypothetical protein
VIIVLSRRRRRRSPTLRYDDAISRDNDDVDGCGMVRIAAIVVDAVSVGGLCRQLAVLADLLLGRNGAAKLNGVRARQRIQQPGGGGQ